MDVKPHDGTGEILDRRLRRDLRLSVAGLVALAALTLLGTWLCARRGTWVGWLLVALGYCGGLWVAALAQRWFTSLLNIREGAQIVVIERVVDLEEGTDGAAR
jgi:hypothetical protein